YGSRPLFFVYGASSDKEIATCMKLITTDAATVYCVAALCERAASPQELAAIGKPYGTCIAASSIESALESALHKAKEQNGLVVVTGTFFIMAAARKFLGYNDPTDPIEVHEGQLTTR
ncbi:MAG TPA: hypothetical protein VN457_08120, partial [Chlamydiales bacterium]|nr:hypothetical protein [Chlamydiales bacterium]